MHRRVITLIQKTTEFVKYHGWAIALPLFWISPVNSFFKIAGGRVCNLTDTGRI